MNTKGKTLEIVMCAIISALIVVLQLLIPPIPLGPFSISLVLVPIVIGVAFCGKNYGWWFGLVFGACVLFGMFKSPTPGDSIFLSTSLHGTIITVLSKGVLCGVCAGVVYDLLKKFSKYLAIVTSAIICPLVNTGVFLIGCRLFFMKPVSEWAQGGGFGENVILYMFVGLVGLNFVFEMLTNIILSPVILRLVNIKNK